LAAEGRGIAVQPVHDLTLSTVAAPALLLAGDAGTILRPHTASGAVKALQDALLLEELFTSGFSLAESLQRYSAVRTNAGNQLVGLGQAIGRDQAEHAPD